MIAVIAETYLCRLCGQTNIGYPRGDGMVELVQTCACPEGSAADGTMGHIKVDSNCECPPSPPEMLCKHVSALLRVTAAPKVAG
jgi:hypothetical protein